MAVLLLSLLSVIPLSAVAEDKVDAETSTGGDHLKIEKKTDDGKKPELRDDRPECYTVVPGDTLWDISDKYFKDPFLWPNIWQNNDYISNPGIKRGLLFLFVDGGVEKCALARSDSM